MGYWLPGNHVVLQFLVRLKMFAALDAVTIALRTSMDRRVRLRFGRSLPSVDLRPLGRPLLPHLGGGVPRGYNLSSRLMIRTQP